MAPVEHTEPRPAGDAASSTPGNKRKLQRERTRARLLDVALTTFAANGFEGTTIRDVASAANVNHGMIKYYFKNKDQLWRAAVTFLFDRMEQELGGEHPEDRDVDPLTLTKNMIRRYVRYCARHPEHARIMVQESIRDNDRLRWAARTFIKPQHAKVHTRNSQPDLQGIWPDINQHSLTYIFIAAAQMPFVLAPELRHLYGIDMMNDHQIEAHADALIELFLNHRAAGLAGD